MQKVVERLREHGHMHVIYMNRDICLFFSGFGRFTRTI